MKQRKSKKKNRKGTSSTVQHSVGYRTHKTVQNSKTRGTQVRNNKQNPRPSKSRFSQRLNFKRILKYISYLCVILLLILLVRNWKSVNDLLDTLVPNNLVISDVIPTEGKSGRKYDSDINKTLLLISSFDDSGVLEISNTYLLLNNEQKGFRAVFYMPGGVYIPLTFTDVSEDSSLSNLHYIGELVKEGMGYSYATWELERYFGMEIDQYIWLLPEAKELFDMEYGGSTDDSSIIYLSRLTQSTRPANVLFRASTTAKMSDYTLSNLSVRDILNTYSLFDTGSFDEYEFYDFSNAKYLETERLTNGEDVPYLYRSVVDDVLLELSDDLVDKGVEKELAKVEVFNGSDISGLASRYSRIIENNGINVIRVDNTDGKNSRTTLYVPRIAEFQSTVDLITTLLPIEVVVSDSRPDFLTTGDVILVLGDDLIEETKWLY